MRFSAIVALLPAVALAAPQINARDAPNCADPNSSNEIYCGLVGEGFNTAAAAYLASQFARPELSTAIDALQTNPAGNAALNSLVKQISGTVLPTGLGAQFVSIFQAEVTALPSGSIRDQVSSVLAQGQALQAGAAAAPAATPTAGATASGAAAPTGANPSVTASGSGAAAGGATSASGSGAAASATKPMSAAAAQATAFGLSGVAVAAIAGVAAFL